MQILTARCTPRPGFISSLLKNKDHILNVSLRGLSNLTLTLPIL